MILRQIHVRVPLGTLEAADALAEARGVRRAAIVRDALAAFVRSPSPPRGVADHVAELAEHLVAIFRRHGDEGLAATAESYAREVIDEERRRNHGIEDAS
jgi:hypothetical protein